MRPTDRSDGAVWRLLDAWAEAERTKDPLDRRVNQEQMAKAFGVKRSILSDWKLRKAQMQVDDMRRVSKITGISVGELSEAVAADMDAIKAHHQERRSRQGGEVHELRTAATKEPATEPAEQSVKTAARKVKRKGSNQE